MGTCNFAHPKNASKYFVVGANREEKYSECECGKFWEWEEEYIEEGTSLCTECGKDVEHDVESRPIEDFEYEDIQEYLIEQLEEIGDFSEQKEYDNERNYGSLILGSLRKGKEYGDTYLSVVLKPIITSAYYEGATLDYIIEIETPNDVYNYNDDEMDDILDSIFDEYVTDINRGLATIFRPYAENWITNTVADLSVEVEKVFEKCSEHKLQRQGVFSNGEAVYQNV